MDQTVQIGQNIALTRVAAGQALADGQFAFPVDIAVRRVEVVKARLQKVVDHFLDLLGVHVLPQHGQTHAAKAEISFDLIHFASPLFFRFYGF